VPAPSPFVAGLEPDELRTRVRRWIEEAIPQTWREAAARGGARAIREVRSRTHYEDWYPTFAATGLVAPAWPVEYGGAGLSAAEARVVEAELAPFNLGRLNPLGLNLAAPALFAHGTEVQRRRFLPPIVANEEVWCQLFSEPGAGSDLASLSTRGVREDDDWVVTGQKVWSTWAHLADFGVLLTRTDPNVPKRRGLTYFIVDMHAPGVEVRPLRHITGDVDFNEVFLDAVRIPDAYRIGAENEGWAVANATLSGERQMVAGSGSGGVDRIGGGGADRLLSLARTSNGHARANWDHEVTRQRLASLWSEDRIRNWTNQRVRAGLKSGRPLGPESSIGKVHQGDLNQRMQIAVVDQLGVGATAWVDVAGERSEGPVTADRYSEGLPYEVMGMLRSRANTIEGGTTEINKNVVAERVLGLPREPDEWRDVTWKDVPRS
jgi:alkylation response protein AidB-like acyl-CoA dehydrogenase